jgi:hypothetical protein
MTVSIAGILNSYGITQEDKDWALLFNLASASTETDMGVRRGLIWLFEERGIRPTLSEDNGVNPQVLFRKE